MSEKKCLTHIVQARITTTRGKHVCHLCGKDAYLMDTAYEAFDSRLMNQLYQELKPLSSFDEAWEKARHSAVSEATYRATVLEQQTVGPRAHNRGYTCYNCMTYMLSKGTGKEHSGDVVLTKLMCAPTSHAVFVVRRLDDPERMLLLNAPSQDPDSILAMLKCKDEIPRTKLITFHPSNEQDKP